MTQAFAGGDGNMGGAGNAGGAFVVFGLAGFFDEPRAIGGQNIAVLNGHRGSCAAMQVDHDVHIRPSTFAGGGHQGIGLFEGRQPIQRGGCAHGKDFHGRKAIGLGPRSLFGKGIYLRGIVDRVAVTAAQMVIHPQARSALPAQKLPKRNAQIFRFKIMQRLVNSRQRRHGHNTALEERMAEHDLPQVFDVARVLA